jgi:hypothetical protein
MPPMYQIAPTGAPLAIATSPGDWPVKSIIGWPDMNPAERSSSR